MLASRPDKRKECEDVGKDEQGKHRLIDVVFEEKGDQFGGVVVGGERDGDGTEGDGCREQNAENAVGVTEEVQDRFVGLGEGPEELGGRPKQRKPDEDRTQKDRYDHPVVEGLGFEGSGGGLFNGGEDLKAVHTRGRS